MFSIQGIIYAAVSDTGGILLETASYTAEGAKAKHGGDCAVWCFISDGVHDCHDVGKWGIVNTSQATPVMLLHHTVSMVFNGHEPGKDGEDE